MGEVIQKQFFHYLRDTIILLGGSTRFADLLDNTESITESDVDDLRQWNVELIDSAKSKLANITYIGITVKGL